MAVAFPPKSSRERMLEAYQMKITGTAPKTADLLAKRAAKPLQASKPQEFDMGGLPLFGDQKNQKELF